MELCAVEGLDVAWERLCDANGMGGGEDGVACELGGGGFVADAVNVEVDGAGGRHGSVEWWEEACGAERGGSLNRLGSL